LRAFIAPEHATRPEAIRTTDANRLSSARTIISPILRDPRSSRRRERVSHAKARLARAGAQTSKVLPHPRRIETHIGNLLAVLETDENAARALLARAC
jgi:hypothetical protein